MGGGSRERKVELVGSMVLGFYNAILNNATDVSRKAMQGTLHRWQRAGKF